MRQVTDHDVKKYEAMVEKYLRDNVQKNWNEASLHRHQDDVVLGNTGMTMRDIRQHLLCEVVVALQKYNPEYRTASGQSVKESTFIFRHLYNRCGQLMKKLTRKSCGYGVWTSNLEETLFEYDPD